MKVEYSSNNSGGRWWLADGHWLALEAAGWEVQWGGTEFCHSKFRSFSRKPWKNICSKSKAKDCPGHRKYKSLDAVGDDRWLGCAAKSASKTFPSMVEAIAEWERVVGMPASAEGCNCCGAPHTFSSDGPERQHVSGSDAADLLIGEPQTLEEAKALIARLRK